MRIMTSFKLLKAQQKTRTDLEQALNVRYAKEGEVSILRKSIEKVRCMIIDET